MNKSKEFNEKKLKKDLIEIYKEYLKNPNNKMIKDKAEKVYMTHLSAEPLMKKSIINAYGLLVDIFLDLPNPPKPSKEIVSNVLKGLKNKKKI